MSKPNTATSTASNNSTSTTATKTSAWARGPPTTTTPSNSTNLPSSNNSSRNPSVPGTPSLPPQQNPPPPSSSAAAVVNGSGNVKGSGVGTNGVASAGGSQGGHSRKTSVFAVGASNGEGRDGKGLGISGVGGGSAARAIPSSINFGSIDSPNSQLSSSPAAHPTTGLHLTDNVKSFGSIEASKDTPSAGVEVGMNGRGRAGSSISGSVNGSRVTSPSLTNATVMPSISSTATGASSSGPGQASAAAAKPKYDIHKLFQSGGGAPQSNPPVNGPTPPQQLPQPTGTSSISTPGSTVSSLPPSVGSYPAQGPRAPMQQAHGYDAQGRPVQLSGLPIGVTSPQPGFNQAHFPPQNPQQHPYAAMSPYPPPQSSQPNSASSSAVGTPGVPGIPQGHRSSISGLPSSGPSPSQNLRSPQINHQQPHYPGQPPNFRPGGGVGMSHQGSQQGRGGPMAGVMVGGGVNPQRGPQGMQQQPYGMQPHPSQMQAGYPMAYAGGPQGGYYTYAQAYGQDFYGMQPQQWPGQQPQQLPLSPRPGSASIAASSPAPPHSGLPTVNGVAPSPVPSSASRPGIPATQSNFSASSSQSSIPGTPSMAASRPIGFQPGTPFTPSYMQPPGSNALPQSPLPSLHASASAFVPRQKSAAIKIKRPDGTAVDIASEAQAAKASPTPAPASTAAAPATPTKTETVVTSTPVKPILPVLPTVVRMETEAQRAARLAEQEKEKKLKELEEKEEKERKEREAARKAREEKEKAEKEKREAEEKEKAEAERIAKEKAEAEELARQAAEKEAAEKEAAEKKKAEEEAAAKKKAEEEEAARKAAEEEGLKKQEQEAAEAKARELAEAKIKADVADSSRRSSLAVDQEEKGPSATLRSATPSPSSSPSLAHAGLPNRPAVPTAGLIDRRKITPSTLSLAPSSTPSSPQIAHASAANVAAAEAITDIRIIIYPQNVSPPNPELNTEGSHIKFRYDREFLLQFMDICKEKPASMPDLDGLGIDRANAPAGGFESSRRESSSRGGSRGGGAGRGGPMGLGIGGMGSFGTKPGPAGMGSFGMGSFSKPAATSEERLAQSRLASASNLGAARNASITRQPSSGPMGSMMPPTGIRDSGSGRNRSVRGQKRGANQASMLSSNDPNVAPLELSANRWAPSVQTRRPGAIDENSPEFVERKVKGLLNKLTQEKFDSLSNQILEWANKSKNETDGQTLRLVIKLIFEKAKDEQFWSSMYARLCRKIMDLLSPEVYDSALVNSEGKPFTGGSLFRKYLLNRCQEEFERGWKKRDEATAAAKAKAQDDQQRKAEHDKAVAAGNGPVEEFKFSDEYYAEQAAKRQGLGLVKFVGELYKLEMLSAKVMNTCILKLLSNVKDPDEEDVESLCQLLTTVGAQYENANPTTAGAVKVYMKRMQELKESPVLTSRLKFMIEDVIELQRHGWKGRKGGQSGPMTIDEVHAQAAREQAEAARAAAALPAISRQDASSRGGSRRGDVRGGFGGIPGANDQWTAVGKGLPPKPADLSAFGTNLKRGGPANFGPSSIFSKGKATKSGDATPPMSRTASSTNLFNVLDTPEARAEELPVETTPSEAGRERKKLNLAPRTRAAEGAGEEENAAAPAEAAPEEGVAGDSEPSSMTTADVDKKIKADLAEFWGEKGVAGTRNIEDLVEFFSGLPEDARSKLATQLVEDVFRLSKKQDTDLVASGLALAVEKGVLSPEIAKQGLAPTIEMLDDLSMDVPQAFSFAAQLIVAVQLPQSDIESLAASIQVEGEPLKHPKDKLLKEVEKLSSAT